LITERASSERRRAVGQHLVFEVGVLVVFTVLGCHRKRPPTYHEDVAPILARNCVGCHRKGGVAPVPLLENYEQVEAAAGKVRLVVQTREMPPWGADNTGLCRTWQGAHWLGDAEIRSLSEWVAAPERGDPAHAAPSPAPPPVSFRASGTVLDTGGDWTPGLGPSAYRCFVVDPGLTTDRLVTAFRVVSSEPRSVEQVTVYGIDSAAAEEAALELDRAEPELGYTCYGSSRVSGARLLTSWTWGSPVLRLPSGTGVRLRAGRRVVVQIHYNAIATGLGVPTRTRIDLELGEGEREASFLAVAPDSFRLPPGLRHTEAKAESRIPRPLTILAVSPRMHSFGKTMQLDLVRAGTSQCMANFDHWNFYAQHLFEYTTPIRTEPGDVVRASCVYDTENRPVATEMGERIDDEECLASLLVTE
jgi:hypothetical protein